MFNFLLIESTDLYDFFFHLVLNIIWFNLILVLISYSKYMAQYLYNNERPLYVPPCNKC